MPSTARLRVRRRVRAGDRCATVLGRDEAETFAEWFSTLSDPTRVRLLHAVSTAPAGHIRSRRPRARARHRPAHRAPTTCSKLAEVGFLNVDRVGTSKSLGQPGLLHGPPARRRCRHGHPRRTALLPEDLPADVTTRAMTDADLPVVRDVYAEGIATRNATFETEVPE